MDPLSIAAGTAQLIALAGSALSKCYAYGSALTSAPHEAKALTTSIRDLSGVLVGIQSVEGLVKYQEQRTRFNSMVHDCRETLLRLNDVLSAKAPRDDLPKMERTLKRLKWPLDRKETLAVFETVEGQKSTLNLVLAELTINLVDDLQGTVGGISLSLNEFRASLDSVSAMVGQSLTEKERDAASQRRADILTWLRKYDHVGVQRTLADAIHPNTCQWLFDTTEFKLWRSETHPALWVRGPSGCGKTLAIASLINHLQQNAHKRTLAYVYCSSNNVLTQAKIDICGSLLNQIIVPKEDVPQVVESYYLSCIVDSGQSQKPTITGLQNCLVDLINDSLGLTGVDLVLDGIDESHDPVQVAEFALDLQKRCPGKVHLLLGSTPSPDLEIILAQSLQLHLRGRQHDLDIERYVSDRLTSMTKFRSLQMPLQQRVKDILTYKAQGMFRWVQCQIDQLGSFRSARDLIAALESLPTTLQAQYNLRLNRMNTTDLQLTRTGLSILMVACHPMHVDELAEASILDLTLISQPGQLSAPFHLDEDARLLNPLDILSILGPFVSVFTLTSVVQLAHHSVRAFLMNAKADLPQLRFATPNMHFEVGIMCLKYLLHVLRSQDLGRISRPLFNEQILASFPLLFYSAKYFPYHIHMSGKEQEVIQLLLQIFSTKEDEIFPRWMAVLRSMTTNDTFYLPGRWSTRDSPLYHAISHGLTATTMALLEGTLDVNDVAGSHGGTMLHAACWTERPDIVGYLLDHGADYNATDENGHTAYGLCFLHHNNEIRNIFKEKQKVPSQPVWFLPYTVSRNIYCVNTEDASRRFKANFPAMPPLAQLLETIRDMGMPIEAVVPYSDYREIYQEALTWIIGEGLLELVEKDAIDLSSCLLDKWETLPTSQTAKTRRRRPQDYDQSQGVGEHDSLRLTTSKSAILPPINEGCETTQLRVQDRDIAWQCCSCGRPVVIGEGEICNDCQHQRCRGCTTAMEVAWDVQGGGFKDHCTGLL